MLLLLLLLLRFIIIIIIIIIIAIIIIIIIIIITLLKRRKCNFSALLCFNNSSWQYISETKQFLKKKLNLNSKIVFLLLK